MAAGLGFKDFVTGEVLTAADVDGYLMQNIWVFASAAARDAAVTAPSEGNFAYLKDTNVTTYYTGSAWANLDTTGMTNPMTTTGDTIYSSSGSTPARLGIGSTGNVLTVAGGVPTWAAPASGGITNWTLLNAGGTALTGAAKITVSFTAPKQLFILMVGASSATARSFFTLRPNDDSGADYSVAGFIIQPSNIATSSFGFGDFSTSTDIDFGTMSNEASTGVFGSCFIDLCDQTGNKFFSVTAGGFQDATGAAGDGAQLFATQGLFEAGATITSVAVLSSTGNFDAGTIYVYGAN